jgi:cytochrome bd-type quinol oxidase subunit 2
MNALVLDTVPIWTLILGVGVFLYVLLVLGAFIQGFEVQGRVFTGHSFDFFTPFSLLTGLALMFGYGLLGAGWLILKTEGELPGLGAVAWPLVFYRGHRGDRYC